MKVDRRGAPQLLSAQGCGLCASEETQRPHLLTDLRNSYIGCCSLMLQSQRPAQARFSRVLRCCVCSRSGAGHAVQVPPVGQPRLAARGPVAQIGVRKANCEPLGLGSVEAVAMSSPRVVPRTASTLQRQEPEDLRVLDTHVSLTCSKQGASPRLEHQVQRGRTTVSNQDCITGPLKGY